MAIDTKVMKATKDNTEKKSPTPKKNTSPFSHVLQ